MDTSKRAQNKQTIFNTFTSTIRKDDKPDAKYNQTILKTNEISPGTSAHPPDERIKALRKALNQLSELHSELGRRQQELLKVREEIESLTFLLDIIFDDKTDSTIVRETIQAILNPPDNVTDGRYQRIVNNIIARGKV